MKRPLVSVITPCFNGENYLDRYFQSILDQTYPNIELIFVNDGSSDKTEEIALSYKEKLEKKGIKYIYLYQDNAGQAAALNKGLKIFTGKYLTWPDSDDTMTPDCIEKKVEFLENNPTYEMVRSNGIYLNEVTGQRKRITDKQNRFNEHIFNDLLVLDTYGCCGCYMITRKIFLSIFPKREIYDSRCGQNWQLLVPCSSYSKCGYIDEDLYIIHIIENSHSRKERIVEDEIKRFDDFLNILLHSIEISKCDIDSSRKAVFKFCTSNQFYYAVSSNNKNLIKEMFERYSKYAKPTLKEIILYLKKMIFI